MLRRPQQGECQRGLAKNWGNRRFETLLSGRHKVNRLDPRMQGADGPVQSLAPDLESVKLSWDTSSSKSNLNYLDLSID